MRWCEDIQPQRVLDQRRILTLVRIGGRMRESMQSSTDRRHLSFQYLSLRMP